MIILDKTKSNAVEPGGLGSPLRIFGCVGTSLQKSIAAPSATSCSSSSISPSTAAPCKKNSSCSRFDDHKSSCQSNHHPWRFYHRYPALLDHSTWSFYNSNIHPPGFSIFSTIPGFQHLNYNLKTRSRQSLWFCWVCPIAAWSGTSAQPGAQALPTVGCFFEFLLYLAEFSRPTMTRCWLKLRNFIKDWFGDSWCQWGLGWLHICGSGYISAGAIFVFAWIYFYFFCPWFIPFWLLFTSSSPTHKTLFCTWCSELSAGAVNSAMDTSIYFERCRYAFMHVTRMLWLSNGTYKWILLNRTVPYILHGPYRYVSCSSYLLAGPWRDFAVMSLCGFVVMLSN